MEKPKLTFTPSCRYQHGDLVRVELKNGEGEPRGMFLPSFRDVGVGPAFADGGGFTVVAFRCPVCGYMEFFDEEAINVR